MATVNIKDFTESKIVRLVDLSDDSINKIAEAVVQKIAEPTEEQVKEYCRKRCLVMVNSELFNEMKTRWGEEKHGHWVEVQRIHETDHTAICECSLCGDTVWVYDGQRAWNYCPNCGCKMEAETK